jgi:hypothetical protein
MRRIGWIYILSCPGEFIGGKKNRQPPVAGQWRQELNGLGYFAFGSLDHSLIACSDEQSH